MAIRHGKSYRVIANEGDSPIFRDGKEVGTFPRCGYSVQVFGQCTGLTGTLIAAHAFAEIHLDVAAHNRSFVLTEAEYEESEEILRRSHVALLEKFPFTPAEKIAVEGSNGRYADIIRQGKENMRRKLLNLPRHTHVVGAMTSRPRPPVLAFERQPGG